MNEKMVVTDVVAPGLEALAEKKGLPVGQQLVPMFAVLYDWEVTGKFRPNLTVREHAWLLRRHRSDFGLDQLTAMRVVEAWRGFGT